MTMACSPIARTPVIAEDARLAAQISCALALPGPYLPVVEGYSLYDNQSKLSGVAAIYQRYDFAEERARALDAWAEHVLTNKAGLRERPLDTAMLVVIGADRTFIRNRPPK